MALGVGFIIAESVIAFTIIKIAGGARTSSISASRRSGTVRRPRTTVANGAPSRGVLRLLLQGFLVGVTNPKTAVFFIAVLPQFVDRSVGNVPLQLATMGVLFVCLALIFDSMWALAAGFARDWFGRSPKRIERLGATGGVMMIGLGTASLFVGNGGKEQRARSPTDPVVGMGARMRRGRDRDDRGARRVQRRAGGEAPQDRAGRELHAPTRWRSPS